MQDVRKFLTYGAITVEGNKIPSLCAYFVRLTKGLQAGHVINVAPPEIRRIILSPEISANHQLLNVSLAFMCDVVHWGLCDLAKKITNPTTKVCKDLALF
jgi:hypothetical protein